MGTTKQLLRIMKMSAFILLVACLQVSARTNAQRITLAEKNVPLGKVFREIRRQTGLSFLYSSEVLNKSGKVSVNVSNATVEETLDQCFRNQSLTYEIDENIIIVRPRQEPPPAPIAAPQGIDIGGRVTDDKGQPLAGASILVRGTNKGTQTDGNGQFMLKNADAGTVLEIRFTGYVTVFIKADGRKEINVSLKPGDNKLDEIVVKGYYATSKRLNTGNVSVIKAEDIANESVINPMQALQGMVPGLFIQQATGMPGAKTNVLLRGANSISNGTIPLYIIDGVPFNGAQVDFQMKAGFTTGNQPNGGTDPLTQINPADIESIQVLKDADATAIYGSRGANGVIIITTKKSATNGKTQLGINLTQGWGQVTRLLPILGTSDYLALRTKAFANDGITPTVTNAPDLLQWSNAQNTNYEKMLIGNTSKITDATVSLSGGDKYTSILVSGSFHNETSVIMGDNGYKKGSLHMKGSHFSQDGKFRMDMSALYSSDKNRMPNADISDPSTTYPGNYPLYNPNGSLYFGGGFTNPVALVRRYYKTNTYNLLLNAALSYSILPNLQIKTNFGLNTIELDQKQIIPPSASNPATPSSGTGFYSINSTKTSIIEPQVDYNTAIGPGRLSATAGGSYQYSYYNEPYYVLAIGFPSEAVIENYSTASTYVVNKSYDAEYKYASVFGRLGYNLYDKYLLNLTFRRDGSSRFGPDRQYGNFGAIGAAWIFSKENFMKQQSLLSYGKLRASYGTVGNDQFGNYNYLDTYSPSFAAYGTTTGFVPTRIANPAYGWETTKKLETGLELGFLDDNILFNASWFLNRSCNELVSAPLTPQTGFSSYSANLPATVQNEGVELELKATLIKKSHFSWNASFNITSSRNKLVAFPNLKTSSYSNTYVVGQPINLLALYNFKGFVNGAATVEDANHDGKISAGLLANGNGDYVVAGTTDPKFYGGFNNSLKYKNWTLDFFFNFVKQLGYGETAFPGTIGNKYAGVLNSGFTPSTVSTSASYSSYTNYYLNSNAKVVDASYIRLRNLSLSYNLPQQWRKALRMTAFRFYVSGQNLLTITHYKGFDPETQTYTSLGVTTTYPPAFPPVRIITLGIQCSF